MLMDLNDRCEDYGMKVNINKTKTMVIGRKPNKIDMRIKDESVEQGNSFKYLECIISSNMNYCQEVKQGIAMAKEAFNRTFGKITTEEATEVFCVECIVVWCRDLGTMAE